MTNYEALLNALKQNILRNKTRPIQRIKEKWGLGESTIDTLYKEEYERSVADTYDFGVQTLQELRESEKKAFDPEKGSTRSLSKERAKARMAAEHLYGIDSRNLDSKGLLLMARLYVASGPEKTATDKTLRKALDMSANGNLNLQDYKKIKDFVDKHSEGDRSSPSNLEKRIGIFIISTLAGIGLSIASLTTTGNTIGNLTNTTPGLLGVFLFVFGLAGLIFTLRKNKFLN